MSKTATDFDPFFTGRAQKHSGAFSITMKNGAQLAQKIGKLKEGGETALKRTVSDFASRAPGWIKQGIRQHYGVDVGAINEAGPRKKKGATHVHISGVTVDGMTLEYKGRTLTPTHFGQSPRSRPSGTKSKYIKVPGQAVNTEGGSPVATIRPPKKYTVKATIVKGHRASMAPGTFIASGNGGSTLPFQRTGDGRMPIEGVRTLSVPQMISGDRAKPTIERLLSENLEKRFEHHVQQAMK